MRATTKRLANSLAFVAVACAALGTAAHAQVGQTAMAPTGGVLNRAVAGFQGLNVNGPGYLYYGINAADRGLGYNGSYMTLGGFVPYGEDDLGGLWAADLRSHFSVNGGFFSNVGVVRKQFLGGSLLGIGVYWDFDGDQNQYPSFGMLGTEWGQFGHSYNQVGVSGEWLTDFGNIRSNGYIPVGTTAYTVGAPGSPFTGNYLLCQYGLDAALAGTDLEVGAYIPGLADWAGMISVGGYAYGNARYDWWSGPQAGQDVVPWFGGVYTRLDMTFLENWDFSLQANNDSYFDWTGFARLTYRMGGSRRRNVPDQVEQPMMRNEHIVRAHQTPIAAINPATGTAWNVIHVDSAAAFGGNGTFGAPVQTLAEAQALAVNPFDIVFVHVGNSATTPYASTWQFQADNQFLVGAGSTLQLDTATCGFKQFFTTVSSTAYPVLTSGGTAITLRNGAVVDHFQMRSVPGSTIQVGIAGNASLTGIANINDVQMVGSNAAGQAGIQLVNVPGGDVNFYNMRVVNMGRGLSIDGGAADVFFQGTLSATASAGQTVQVQNMNGGSASVNVTSDTLFTGVARNRAATEPLAILDTNSTAAAPIEISSNIDTAVSIGQVRIVTPTQAGVSVQGNASTPVRFTNLVVENAAQESLIMQSNGPASSLTINGASRLSSTSATGPALRTNDDAALAITLVSLQSAVPTTAPPYAIDLQGTSPGFVSIVDDFLVAGGANGTAANVNNGTPATVNLP
jgi:hypothetical protein